MAKRLEIDSAPAMVGFEFRNGRSTPVFDGIVVCAEFKDTILEVKYIWTSCLSACFLVKFETFTKCSGVSQIREIH